MEAEVLEKDSVIRFPHFEVLRASAGSGKTYALTERFVQFILSDRVPRNDLRNILAITFSNNAAREMKRRILERLKVYALGNRQMIKDIEGTAGKSDGSDRTAVNEDPGCKAERMIEHILNNYSDMNIKTIDSFMATLFKASAIDLGINPDFEILMDNRSLFEYAFELYLRDIREDTEEESHLREAIEMIIEYRSGSSSYPWDPSGVLLNEMRNLNRKISSLPKEVRYHDPGNALDSISKALSGQAYRLNQLVEESGLERNSRSSLSKIVEIINSGRNSLAQNFGGTTAFGLTDLIKLSLTYPPVKKVSGKSSKSGIYNEILQEWETFKEQITEFISLYVESYYTPYLKVFSRFMGVLEDTKAASCSIFIEDINYRLSEYLSSDIVPDVYFRLGERIFHYLIDEFQDTSPIQWRNLYPMIENALSEGGSLFVVGDTKQAIYGFRDADYSIMMSLSERSPFPSSTHTVKDLDINYRSHEEILRFTERVFKERVGDSGYAEAAVRSGLTEYKQKPKEEHAGKGYVEAILLPKDNSGRPEKEAVQDLIEILRGRGYRFRDISILTQTNANVTDVTSWLNERGIHFISHSGLDIRQRCLTGEIVSLLKFLDSPIDDLSFAAFITGGIFSTVLSTAGVTGDDVRGFLFRNLERRPLYKYFRDEFGGVWDAVLEELFNCTGYLPLYDLVTLAIKRLKLFEVPGQEDSTLVRLLEVIKNFEDKGSNSLKDFILFLEGSGESSEWTIEVPKGIDAVNVMTIHKAKGLEFPVVILLLYGERLNMRFPYIVNEVKDGFTLLKINRDITKNHLDYERLYNEELTKGITDSLNTLYVGLTRAKAELYLIGVKGERDTYPFDVLPFDEFSPACMGSPESQRPFGIKGRPPDVFPDISSPVGINVTPYYHRGFVSMKAEPFQSLNLKEKQRGEFIHRVLYLMEFISGDTGKCLKEAMQMASSMTEDRELPLGEIEQGLLSFLKLKEVRDYFIPLEGREVFREWECSNRWGTLYRMDRVVVDPDRVTVIDFKTGGDTEGEEEGYFKQVSGYMNILRDIYPEREVSGLIAYVDRKKFRRVG